MLCQFFYIVIWKCRHFMVLFGKMFISVLFSKVWWQCLFLERYLKTWGMFCDSAWQKLFLNIIALFIYSIIIILILISICIFIKFSENVLDILWFCMSNCVLFLYISIFYILMSIFIFIKLSEMWRTVFISANFFKILNVNIYFYKAIWKHVVDILWSCTTKLKSVLTAVLMLWQNCA